LNDGRAKGKERKNEGINSAFIDPYRSVCRAAIRLLDPKDSSSDGPILFKNRFSGATGQPLPVHAKSSGWSQRCWAPVEVGFHEPEVYSRSEITKMQLSFTIIKVGEPKMANSGKQYIEALTKMRITIAFWERESISMIQKAKAPFRVTCDCKHTPEEVTRNLPHKYWAREKGKMIITELHTKRRMTK